MSANHTDSQDHLVSEILELWESFDQDLDKRLGKAVGELLKLAIDYSNAHDYRTMQRCCEIAGEVVAEFENDYKGDMDTLLGDGTVKFYTAVSYIGQGKMDLAVDYFRASSEKFGYAEYLAAALSSVAAGKVCLYLARYREALPAFQRALNMLDNKMVDRIYRFGRNDDNSQRAQVLIEREFERAKEGLKKALPNRKRSDRTIAFDHSNPEATAIPVVRKVAAGTPNALIEDIFNFTLLEKDNLLDRFISDLDHLRGADLAFVVEGESMKEDGIKSGDYAVVKLVNVASNGETVVAGIYNDGEIPETTLKKYYEEVEGKHWRLEPCNGSYPSIIVVPSGVDLNKVETRYAREGKKIEIRRGQVRVIGKLVAIWRGARG